MIVFFIMSFVGHSFYLYYYTKMRATSIRVTIQVLWERDQVISLPMDPTVKQAVEEAWFTMANTPRVNGVVCDWTEILDDGDIIVLQTKKINQG